MRDLWDAITDTDVMTACIAGLSLLVSGLVLIAGRRAAGQAHFTADWESPSIVLLVNHGPGAARDLRAQLTHNSPHTKPTEVPYVGSRQVTRVLSVLGVGQDLGVLEVSWRDNRWRRQSMPIHVSWPPPSLTPAPLPRDDLEKVVRAVARDEARREVADHDRRGGPSSWY